MLSEEWGFHTVRKGFGFMSELAAAGADISVGLLFAD
jgi:hypothetical protein